MDNLIRVQNPNFTKFMQEPWVQKLKNMERWTVVQIIKTADKTKKIPVDMFDLIYKQRFTGMVPDEPYSMCTLDYLYHVLPDAKNFTFLLSASIHEIVVLDIEPICPKEIRDKLMNMPCLYAEVSMSGKGIHMVFPAPYESFLQYPAVKDKNAIKYEKYYEILINHNVSFTGDQIPHRQITCDADKEPFLQMFNNMAKQQRDKTKKIININISDFEINNDPAIQEIVKMLRNFTEQPNMQRFIEQGINNPETDMSRFDYRYMWRLNTNIDSILEVQRIKQLMNGKPLSLENRILIIGHVAKEHLEHREKHDRIIDNLPYLLYVARAAVNDRIAEKQKEDSE